MKILHINCNYIGTTLHQLMIEKLDKKNIENQVYVPTYNHKIATIVPNANVCVSECFDKWDRVWFDYKQKKIISDIQEKIDISCFDCIHAYTVFTDGNCAMNLSKKYGIPYVVAVRNTDINDFFSKMIHLRTRGLEIIKNASAVFFLSNTYKRQLLEKFIPAEMKKEVSEKSYVIPNGIDDFWFVNEPSIQRHIDCKNVRIIYAGRIDKNKNIPTIQKALSILRKKGWNISLTVVGRIDDKNEYRKIKKDIFTTYIEAQSKENLLKLYRQHDIFVMPSFKESFGLVYAEAMSQGMPVVYTREQGFDGRFAEGEVGYSVLPNEAEGLADVIAKVVEQYNYICKNTVKCARCFQWEDICNKYKEIYFELLSNNT